MRYLLKILYNNHGYEFHELAVINVLEGETLSEVVIEHMEGLFIHLDREMANMYQELSFFDGSVTAQLQSCDWLPNEHSEILMKYL